MSKKRGTMARAASLLVGLEVLAQATALGKQLLVAALFGTSALMDGYFVAVSIGALVALWFKLPINQVVIPMFRHDLRQLGETGAWRNLSVLFNNSAVILIGVACLAAAAAPWIVLVVAPGFTKEIYEITVELTRLTMPSVVLLVLSTVLSQIFFSYRRFFIPGFAQVFDNLVAIGLIWILTDAYGIHGLVLALVFGDLAQFLLQVPILRSRRSFRWTVDFRHPQMAEMGRLGGPLLLSQGGLELSRITDRMFASLLPSGSLSSLAYGSRLLSLLSDLIVSPVAQSTYPHFAELAADRDFRGLSRDLFRYLNLLLFVTLPVAVGAMVTARPLVSLVFERGAFDAESTRLTAQALAFFALSFPASALAKAVNRTFFTLKETWIPSKLSLYRFAIKIPLALALVFPLGHVGIALAETVSHLARLFFLLRSVIRRLESEDVFAFAGSLARTSLAATVMGVGVVAAQPWIAPALPPVAELLASVVLGTVLYALTALAIQREQMWAVVETARAALGRRGR